MRRFLLVIAIFIMTVSGAYSAPIHSDIADNTTVYYSPLDRKWSSVPTTASIPLTKRYTVGANRFSEYVVSGLAHDANSTQEFFYKGDLIGYNKNTLKFHRLYFEEGTLRTEQLNEKEIQELFPEATIIRISQFTDNTIKLKRKFFENKTYLLMNDTNKMFYSYWFKGVDNSGEMFNCIFTPDRNGKIDFLPTEKSVTYTPYYIRLKYVL